MLKKAILYSAFGLFVGLMVIGAYNRSLIQFDRLNPGAESAEAHESHDEAETAAVVDPIAGWRAVSGTATLVNADGLTILAEDGEVWVEGQPWSYASSSGFSATPGDSLRLEGYDESGEFKVGRLTNLSTGQMVVLRDAAGVPAWRGSGRGQSGS
jgi:hypothetical protein